MTVGDLFKAIATSAASWEMEVIVEVDRDGGCVSLKSARVGIMGGQVLVLVPAGVDDDDEAD